LLVVGHPSPEVSHLLSRCPLSFVAVDGLPIKALVAGAAPTGSQAQNRPRAIAIRSWFAKPSAAIPTRAPIRDRRGETMDKPGRNRRLREIDAFD
jgi:hypothetical protein